MRTWVLAVHGSKDKRTLALVAPHGTFPVAGLAPPVRELIAKLETGVELECVGEGFNISTVVVDRIIGPVALLEPHVHVLPDAWVHSVGELAITRARKRLAANEDATSDLLAALRAEVPGLEVDVARLRDRTAIEDAYAKWSLTQKTTPEILGLLRLEKWSAEQLESAAAFAIARAGSFGVMSAESILAELDRRGSDTKALTKKLAKLRKASGGSASPAKTSCVRIETALQDVHVIGGSANAVYVSASERATGGTWRGARFVQDPDIPLLVAFDRTGRESRRHAGTDFNRVSGDYALFIDQGSTSYVARLDTLEVVVSYAHGIRAFDGKIVWGVSEQKYEPFRMRSEVRTLDGKVIAKFWPDDIHHVRADAKNLYVTRVLRDKKGEYVNAENDSVLDRISIATGKVIDSTPIKRYGVSTREHGVVITSLEGTKELPVAPWSLGYWSHESVEGYETHWLKTQLFISGPPASKKERAWVALELTSVPDAVDLAPPWLALHTETGVLAIDLDELLSTKELRFEGKVLAKRQKVVERPVPPKKVLAWFATIVAHGLIPEMEPVERDRLLFSKLEDVKWPRKDTLAHIVEDRSPRAVSHDAHWFEKSDRIIARFDSALEGEVVRFTEKTISEGSVEIGVRSPKGKTTLTCEPLIHEVAEVLDAQLEQHKAKKRIYALRSYQEDIFVYLVLTPAERERLIDAGIEGIEKNATARLIE